MTLHLSFLTKCKLVKESVKENLTSELNIVYTNKGNNSEITKVKNLTNTNQNFL
jgi:hypothetical protein